MSKLLHKFHLAVALFTFWLCQVQVARAWEVVTVFGIRIKGGNAGDQPMGALINQILTIAYMLAGGTAIVMIIIGAFRYITAAGNAKDSQEAKDIIQSAVTGLVVVFVAYLIADVLGGSALTTPKL